MKNKYKYLILIIITIISSYAIYTYIEANQMVETKEDILNTQVAWEEASLKSENYTLENPNVITNPYGISPLTALIVFETNDLTAVNVTIKGKDGDEDITNTFTPAKVHTLPIYGLYPDYENTVIIRSGKETKEIKIKTSSVPENIKNISVDNSLDTNDFYFTISNTGFPVAYDKNGNIRWYLNQNYKWDITRLNNGHLLVGSDTTIGTNYSNSLVEIDLLGKVYSKYNLKGGYHNSVYELASGNFLVATNNLNSGTTEDYIVEIDRSTGEVIKTIDLYDLIPNNGGSNWFGLNAVCYDSKTNSILVTGNKKNLILNIDYASGEINWIIANKTDIPSKYKKYLLNPDGDINYPKNPSSITILENNQIAFINSEDNDKYLTIYNVDFNNRSFNQIKNIQISKQDTGSSKLTYNQEKGFLITTNKKIINIQNDEAKEIGGTSDITSARLLHLYDSDIYMPGQGQRLGSTGTTKTAKSNMILFTKSDDKIYDKYNLTIYKEPTRLVVNGKFDKKDKVQIILDNVFDKKTYNITVPYENDKQYIDSQTYINEEGLKGKYYIYIKINGTIYKLHKYVNFW